MTTEILTSTEQLQNIESEWRELWQRAANATPFQSPDWLLPWWSRFAGEGAYAIAMRGDDGRLEGFAPLYILRDDDSGESLAMLLGTGTSDYLDILVAEDADPQPIIDAICAADCQVWDFQQLRPTSPLLTATLPEGWSDNVEDQEPCPQLQIAGAGDELEKLISTHFRKKIRYYRRAIAKSAAVSIETPTEETLDDLLTALFALHAARWKQRGLPGVLADDIIQEFHRDAARRFLRAGALRLYAMHIGDRIGAVFYGFAHQGIVNYYLSGYDPELEKMSIGTLLVAHAIEQAVRDGAQTFDFLRGAEEYKYAWGAKDRMNRQRQLIRPMA